MKKLLLLTTLILAAPLGALADDTAHGMSEMRKHLQQHHGGATFWYVEGERLEYRSNEGDPVFLWDAQGWYGGDINRLWVKTEGEFDFDADEFEEAEVQALYSRAVGDFFDLQAGIRHDFAPGNDRTFAVVGAQGLLPYLFEIDAALFVSDDGDVEARVEAEYELLITQRLILQPRAELNFAAQDIAEYGIGAGLSTVETGARLRYEISRQFAPYVGVSWERAVGDSADFARIDGDEPGSVSFVAGFRTWF
ncbi:copper resistance protein B [Hyphococcus flavus]|uniref:Copper resistance protein B n=1 Tax=Hyphococcus flavus TaxID=1866326 RepID=A0AAF0CFI6_9PROT|nr:copper resistance protein B [Hyphococcus flavus]WDI30973.1 copper resistance protein B [Hyphococcus flavus]